MDLTCIIYGNDKFLELESSTMKYDEVSRYVKLIREFGYYKDGIQYDYNYATVASFGTFHIFLETRG